MTSFLPTIILRHRKENLKKCSLRGLEVRDDLIFFPYPLKRELPSLDNYIHLALDAPPLTPEDGQNGLVLLDSTWKYEKQMRKSLPTGMKARSIPNLYKTAYPRKQTDCDDPEHGLATVEALFLAYHLMGRDTSGLLDHYYWKDQFLKLTML